MMEPDVSVVGVLAQGDYYIDVCVKITFFLFNIITCHMLKRFTVQFQSHDHKQCCPMDVAICEGKT